MKTIVLVSLVVNLLGAGAVAAQELTRDPAGFGLLEGTDGHPELAVVPREDRIPSASPVVAEAAAERPPLRGTPLSAVALDSLKATRDRPIFSETRRPPVVAVAEPVTQDEPPPEPKPVEPETPSLTLVGTAVGLERTVAVFLSSTTRQVVTLRIGDEDSGWTLRSVEPKTTTLEKDSHTVTLSLPAPDAASESGLDAPDGVNAYLQHSLGEPPAERPVRRGGPPPFPNRLPGRNGLPPKPQIGEEF